MGINQEDKPSVSESKEEQVVERQVEAVQKIAEGSIEGQVACTEGPMVNATVSVGMNSTFTGSKGDFLLEHVPPGIAKIRAKSPTSRFYDSTLDILVEADKRNNLFIFLTEVTGTVEGTVLDENEKPLFGAEVSGLFRLAKPAEIAKTDENGHYEFKDIPRGSYYVRAKAEGHMIEGISANVTGGNKTVADFKLRSGSLTITGKVVSKGGAPIDCELFLMRRGLVVTRAYASKTAEGKFVFDNLVPDIYEIGTSAPGYIPKGWHGKLDKSERVDFELEVQPHQEPSEFHHM